MGEAKRKREAGVLPWRWKDPAKEPPPDNAHNLAIIVTITCSCARGGKVALCVARESGEWIIPPFDHSFEIERWLKLPDFPWPDSSIH